MRTPPPPEAELLLCAPFGKDARILRGVVQLDHLAARECKTLDELAGLVNPDTLLILLTEEAIASSSPEKLRLALASQDPWSDIPIVLLSSAGDAVSPGVARFTAELGGKANLSIMERPVRIPTLRSTLESAIRARGRQYQVRGLLLQELESAARLRDARDQLERRVQERTKALSEANVELARGIGERQRAEAVLRNLSTRVLNIQDEERRRIARDLHDGVGQILSLTVMTLSQAMRKCEALGPAAEKLIGESNELLHQSIQELRTVSHLLHPPLLDEMGLASALRWYIDEFSKRSGIPVTLEIPEKFARLESDSETAIFRIVQESLTNVHRHSSASSVRITIGRNKNCFELKIEDNGKGIARDILEKSISGLSGVGFASMRERSHQLAGTFDVESGPQGTTIFVSIPFKRRAVTV